MRHGPQLIAYADRLAGDLPGLGRLLDGPLSGAFDGVHVLPFFVPIDGADAGFDPIDHTAVDPRLGSWDDVGSLAGDRTVMADLILNPVSVDSREMQDWITGGDRSPYANLFLAPEMVFGGPTSEADVAAIPRPQPTPPFQTIRL
ncbi:MAG: sucrose phosphorylase, partial [Ilumatobacteraceae bacterium]